MPGTLTLAVVHHSGGIPDPLTILLGIAAVGYVMWSRLKGQPLQAKRLLVLPAVLIVIGILGLTGSSARHLTSADLAFLAISVVTSVVLGAARGATIQLYNNQGELWQRYRLSTVGLWIALIATKIVLMGVAGATGAAAGGGTNSLLVSLGASLLAEAAIVGPRALSTGVPFAADRKRSDADRRGRHGQDGPAPDLDRQRRDGRSWPAQGWDNGTSMPDKRDRTGQGDAAGWSSPSWRDGLDWLRNQLDDPGEGRR